MSVTHEPGLVALAVILAIQGSYVGLSLAVRMENASGLRRRLLLVGSAVSLALAVWTMHFVSMLAAHTPFPVDFLVAPTLLSFLVCVIVVGAAVLAVSVGPPTPLRLVAAALFMGLGIVSMHYIGMLALQASARMVYSPAYVVASAVVAVGASGLALWLAVNRPSRAPFVAAIALGLAICGMHYVAMAGLTIYPRDLTAVAAPLLSPDLLAMVVAMVAFLVSGGFLLVLVPDRFARTAEIATPLSAKAAYAPASRERVAKKWQPVFHEVRAETTQSGAPNKASLTALPPDLSINRAAFGTGAFPPLGGVGGPPRRTASRIPVEHNGRTGFISADEIVAVHANAHYTNIFDGNATHFCELAISEVEQRLDPRCFVRVHRSHIVNLGCIVSIKLNCDGGLLEMAASERHMVPVSRGRVARIRSRLNGVVGIVAE